MPAARAAPSRLIPPSALATASSRLLPRPSRSRRARPRSSAGVRPVAIGTATMAQAPGLLSLPGQLAGRRRRSRLPVAGMTPDLRVVASDGPSLSGRDVDFGATPTLYPASGVKSGCLAVMNKRGALFVYARGAIGGGYKQRLQMGNNRLADHGDFISNPAFDPTLRLLYVNVPVPAPPYVRGVVALRVAPDCSLSRAWQHLTAPNVFMGDYPSITPTVANGVVYVMRSNNSVAYAFDAATGAQLWSSGTRVKGLIYTAATVANGQLLVASYGGTVYAFAP